VHSRGRVRRFHIEELNMKKFALAVAAIAAFTGSAMAADMAPHTYAKAPMAMPMAPSWTGFYIFGGAGGGLWAGDQHTQTTVGGIPLAIDQRDGGSGWFGTVGTGYDWQFNQSWVFGILADGQFGSLRGTIHDTFAGLSGFEKIEDSWAAGARLGYLVAPNVLSYVNAGYSGAHFSGTSMISTATGATAGVHTNSFNRNGWFVGGGVENNLNIFGITAPGWFMKTEYRSAFYDAKNTTEFFDVNNVPTGRDIRFNTWTQTISTSLVYRFNWTGAPIAARY
jgi:outer membrane immunogenic protein